ncbi:MAG TPA: MFS transporter, partial [Chloroflexota bacterium]|nr:MFS transporter [Chloroflexota bacterium]
GAAMLAGSVAGGFIAQVTTLGTPYVVRALMLLVTLGVAWRFMHDLGFTPKRRAGVIVEMRIVLAGAVDGGLKNPPVRWLMLAAPFSGGVTIYAFYAMQPYLLQLYGDPSAYTIAGLAAAIVAGAQIVGGLIVPFVRRIFRRRTEAMIVGTVLNTLLLLVIGLTGSFWLALALLVTWGLVYAIELPLRQAFINGVIRSEQRATVLSFDSLMASAGGVVAQPGLGRVADVFGYSASYLVSAAIQVLAVPFVVLARRENASSDPIVDDAVEQTAVASL